MTSVTTPSKKKRKLPKYIAQKLPWHQSWILRGTALSSAVIICGFLASVAMTLQGINTITQIVYDPEIESLLNQHLDSIKEIHTLRQEILVNRLQREIQPHYRAQPEKHVNPKIIRRWLKEANFGEIANVNKIKMSLYSPSPEQKDELDMVANPIIWVSKSSLRIFQYIVELPEGKTKQSFKLANALRQRYKLIRKTWSDQIRPAIIQVNTLIITFSLILFIFILILIARKFQKRIESLLEGFSIWSEHITDYRFDKKWTGELKLITEQFNQMANEVEINRRRRLYLEKVSSWQIIARKLAHEIKNPLTPIQMMVSQLVRKYSGSDPDFKKLLTDAQNIILEEINSLRKMVDNFSQFAQLPEINLSTHSLEVICNHCIELEKAAFPQHKIYFVDDTADSTTLVDDTLLKRVIINLIKNAAEASGNDPAEIRIKLSKTEKNYEICILDKGPGIPEDMQARIFEAYFTTKHTGPSPGMGLGLAVCQKVIIDHGGDLTVNSKPGNTEFKISIPIK